MATRKAVDGGSRNAARSRQTGSAEGKKGSGGQQSARSGHTTKALGMSKPPGASKGGGTSKQTRAIFGTQGKPYEKRNTTGIPMSR